MAIKNIHLNPDSKIYIRIIDAYVGREPYLSVTFIWNITGCV